MGLAESKQHHSYSSEIGSLQHHDNNGPLNSAFSNQQTAGEAGDSNTTCKHQRRPSSGPALLKAFVGKPAGWGTEPRIVLANQSAYRVSYWVAEEDKQQNNSTSSARRQQQAVASMNLHLNIGGGETGSSSSAGGLSRGTTQETTATEQSQSSPPPPPVGLDDEVYFLTRDHRMGPMGDTQATKVAFPVDCQDMRVYAFFEWDGLWRLYEDKVYSIGVFKKVFTLTSRDDNITPHIDQSCQETTAAAATGAAAVSGPFGRSEAAQGNPVWSRARPRHGGVKAARLRGLHGIAAQ